MDDKKIGAFLRQMRKTSGMTADEVSESLLKDGFEISNKTLYKYETSKNMPNADVFLALCKVYQCDNPMEILGGSTITPAENNLVRKFRLLSPRTQETISRLIDLEILEIQDD